MLTTAAVAAFLDAEGLTATVSADSEFPDMPDECIVLRLTGGAGESYEREFVRPTLQVLSRGRQNDAPSAEAVAHAVDAILMGAERPVIGAYVSTIQYVGGPPGYVTRDEAGRTVMSANYLLEVAR